MSTCGIGALQPTAAVEQGERFTKQWIAPVTRPANRMFMHRLVSGEHPDLPRNRAARGGGDPSNQSLPPRAARSLGFMAELADLMSTGEAAHLLGCSRQHV